MLLGLLREDKTLTDSFLPSPAAESIRKQIESHATPRQKVSTSVDLPLSHESKRVLAYAAEEAERLHQKHIGTGHLLLGLLREEQSFAAQMLRERGVNIDLVREKVRHTDGSVAPAAPAHFPALDQWLAACEARGGIRTAKQKRIANRTTYVAVYAGDGPKESERVQDPAAAEQLDTIRTRIGLIIQEMERAIASHQFEKARSYSDEERKERQNLRALLQQSNLEETPRQVPLLCIEIIRDETFSEVQTRCDDYLAAGVPQVWLLNPDLKRAYTVTRTEGLRECKDATLQLKDPPLEMDLKKIFNQHPGV